MYSVGTMDDIRTNNEPYHQFRRRQWQQICGSCWLAWDQDDRGRVSSDARLLDEAKRGKSTKMS